MSGVYVIRTGCVHTYGSGVTGEVGAIVVTEATCKESDALTVSRGECDTGNAGWYNASALIERVIVHVRVLGL